MFLDDKITEYVLNNIPKTKSELTTVNQKVIDICFERLRELFNSENGTDAMINNNIKQVCNAFDLSAKNIEKKLGYGFFKVGGFKALLFADEKFAPLLKKIGFK